MLLNIIKTFKAFLYFCNFTKLIPRVRQEQHRHGNGGEERRRGQGALRWAASVLRSTSCASKWATRARRR